MILQGWAAVPEAAIHKHDHTFQAKQKSDRTLAARGRRPSHGSACRVSNLSGTCLRQPLIPASRISASRHFSVVPLPFEQMRDITSLRFSGLKTSGMAEGLHPQHNHLCQIRIQGENPAVKAESLTSWTSALHADALERKTLRTGAPVRSVKGVHQMSQTTTLSTRTMPGIFSNSASTSTEGVLSSVSRVSAVPPSLLRLRLMSAMFTWFWPRMLL